MTALSAFAYSPAPRQTGFAPLSPAQLGEIRAANPLPAVAGAMVKLRKAGREFVGLCPFHHEKTPSFTIYDGGERFKCHGCGEAGDVIDFVRTAYGCTFTEAIDRLDGNALPKVDYAKTVIERETIDRTPEALAIWDASESATGTPAEAYLRQRAIRLPLPPSIRFTRLCYGNSGPQYPVLVALVQNVAGEGIGIQRTYLAPAGSGKASVAKPKLSLGSIRGGAIRIGEASATMAVCEGLEDGLTLAQELDGPVWVSAGTSNLAALELPVSVRSVIIGADNDSAGASAAAKAGEAFATRGHSVRIIHPLDGHKDFNSEAMAFAKAGA